MAQRTKVATRNDAYAQLGVDTPNPAGGKPAGAGPASSARGPQGGKRPPRITPIAVVIGILVVVYLGGAFFFSSVFYPNTTLGGEDVSLKLESEVAQAHSESAANKVLTVNLGDTTIGEVTGTSVDLARDGAAYAHSAIATQNSFLWPLLAWHRHELNFPEVASFDADKLHAAVTKMVEEYNSYAIEPRNATAEYDTTSGTYKLVSAEEGTTIDEAKVEAVVSEALVNQQTEVSLPDDCYVQPTVYDDDEKLSRAIKDVNDKLSATQTLTVENKQVSKVSSQQIGTWVSLDDDLNISIDEEAITTWCQGDLSKELDTVGSTRNYTLPDGTGVSVTGGTYGWIIDGAAVAEQIVAGIESGKAGTIEVPMKQKAAVHAENGGADWGNRWIDVNLSTQHAAFYDNNNTIWETDVVSGNVTEGYGTPTGVYTINKYMTSVEVTGEQVKLISPFVDEKGEPTYTSYVDYWMPFIDNQYAFHDASWREAFGGDIYLTGGSHGCVNLPADMAKELYHMVSVGEVVVVHD